ncbi:hypothetical protein PIB30_030956 [Stylosanthes scabra]|uniref:Uncharacterized protein n=1 Tax=Stylosanthes scabra TaxID=79078 RepID=A0ABU6SC01_9FABA|nr:hypothetical protein [Stylosanthes scabra]
MALSKDGSTTCGGILRDGEGRFIACFSANLVNAEPNEPSPLQACAVPMSPTDESPMKQVVFIGTSIPVVVKVGSTWPKVSELCMGARLYSVAEERSCLLLSLSCTPDRVVVRRSGRVRPVHDTSRRCPTYLYKSNVLVTCVENMGLAHVLVFTGVLDPSLLGRVRIPPLGLVKRSYTSLPLSPPSFSSVKQPYQGPCWEYLFSSTVDESYSSFFLFTVSRVFNFKYCPLLPFTRFVGF